MPDRPDDPPETRPETHYEWLMRTVEHADRRITPFAYDQPTDFFERREWDIRNSATKP